MVDRQVFGACTGYCAHLQHRSDYPLAPGVHSRLLVNDGNPGLCKVFMSHPPHC